MPSPLLVPVLSLILTPSPLVAASNTNADLARAGLVASPTVQASSVATPAETVIVATRSAGNARMPLYDDGCAATKGGCSVQR